MGAAKSKAAIVKAIGGNGVVTIVKTIAAVVSATIRKDASKREVAAVPA